MNELEILKQQHILNYRNAVLTIIKNNTNSLIDDDICSLIKIPPLDSMDQIKVKLLAIAKKNNIILQSNNMNKIVVECREKLVALMNKIKKLRMDDLINLANQFNLEEENQVIKVTKKDLAVINKKIKKELKNNINIILQSIIIDKMELIIPEDISENSKGKILNDVIKFVGSKGSYQKQLLENIDFKILVKDTTLINGIKEQSERYIFTKNNSRLFN